jgi:hypothetical protein
MTGQNTAVWNWNLYYEGRCLCQVNNFNLKYFQMHIRHHLSGIDSIRDVSFRDLNLNFLS